MLHRVATCRYLRDTPKFTSIATIRHGGYDGEVNQDRLQYMLATLVTRFSYYPDFYTTPYIWSPPAHSFTSTFSHPTRLPKLEVPLFSGGNILTWSFKIKNVFTYHHIPEEQKLDVLAFYMTSPAL